VDPNTYYAYLAQLPATVPQTQVAASTEVPTATSVVTPASQPNRGDAIQQPVTSSQTTNRSRSATGSVAQTTPPVNNQTAGSIAWPDTPAQVIAQGNAGNKPPEMVAAKEAVSAEFDAIETLGKKAYPKYAHLVDEYKELYDEEKEAWRAQNPMFRAINLAGYNPNEHAYVEKTFGKGSVQRWALIPASEFAGGEEGARAAYYRQYPAVFEVKAWIDGRPQPYVERDETLDQPFERNFGKDYETAKEMFGKDIWGIVKQYYTIPPYTPGGDNKAWIAFKEKYPQFDAWADWWYALLPDNASEKERKGFTPFQRGNFGSFSFGDPTMGEHPHYIENVEAQRGNIPKWDSGVSAGDGDWRKYLALGEVKLKGWSR
jgi:hypothetical protein